MHLFCLTLLPMLLAALFTMIGGERLAVREIEDRIPADREKLIDFSFLCQQELSRLNILYHNGLDGIVEMYELHGADDTDELVRGNSFAVKSIYVFNRRKKLYESRVFGAGSASVPKVGIEKKVSPMRSKRAYIFPISIFDEAAEDAEGAEGVNGWRDFPDGLHCLYWRLMADGRLIVLVVNKSELEDTINKHFQEWLTKPMAPLVESGQYFTIESGADQIVVDHRADGQRGAAAIMIPVGTKLWDWRVLAWDGVSVRKSYDLLVVTLASLLGIFFLVVGLFLYLQQKRAIALARKRVSFVNQVSHELGSPLTNMTLNLDLAVDLLDSDPAGARRRMGVISQEVARLNRMVANVLTFSQQDRGVLELHVESVVPDALLSELVDSFRPALERRKLEVEVEYGAGVDFSIDCDSDALLQIVANLISNVEKYAYSGRWMAVRTSCDDEFYRVSVVDRGPGIPVDAHERVFQSFERVENSVSEGSSGTGLGLSIARDLAIKLGGALRVIEVDEGCHVELLLPIDGGEML